MWVTSLTVLWAVAFVCSAEDTCPDVKVIGIGDSDKLTILRGCPGLPGSPGQMGEAGAAGLKGEKGEQGTAGKSGPLGEKGVKGSTGEKGEKGEKGDFKSSDSLYRARNCKELLDQGEVLSDWYTVYPEGQKPIKVLCDMHSDGGGWIVFQRRYDGSVDFYRNWNSYKNGFGSRMTEFWLGNDNIHTLTSSGTWELRIDLLAFDNIHHYAKYESFQILEESENYKLSLGPFTEGNAGDSMTFQANMPFSTMDKDFTTMKCPINHIGAWWYNACHYSNLNGRYLQGQHESYADGINWRTGNGYHSSYKMSEMKIRPRS